MSDKTTLVLTTLLVTSLSITHLVRFFWNIPISLGPLTLPGWTGALFFLGFGLLSAWAFRAIRSIPKTPPKALDDPYLTPPTNSSNP
jgi:hypothetical protein